MATLAPQPTTDAPEMRVEQSPENDSQTLRTALSASRVAFEYDGGECYAVLPDGRHTRAYLNQEAARRAVERGAIFTRAAYVKVCRRVPAWYKYTP